MVYQNNPKTLDNLERNIVNEIMAITPNVITSTMKNMKERMNECITQNGNHLKDVIFKKWVSFEQYNFILQKLHYFSFKMDKQL